MRVLGKLYLIMPRGMNAVSTRGEAAKTRPTRNVLPPRYLRRESNLSGLRIARELSQAGTKSHYRRHLDKTNSLVGGCWTGDEIDYYQERGSWDERDNIPN